MTADAMKLSAKGVGWNDNGAGPTTIDKDTGFKPNTCVWNIAWNLLHAQGVKGVSNAQVLQRATELVAAYNKQPSAGTIHNPDIVTKHQLDGIATLARSTAIGSPPAPTKVKVKVKSVVPSASPPSSVGPANVGQSSPTMVKLAASALKATEGRTTSIHLCETYVEKALRDAGIQNPRRPSAYQTADYLAGDKRFVEMTGAYKTGSSLRGLPAGAIVVWDQGMRQNGSYAQHGHISVADGKGNEMSDFMTRQMTNYTTGGYRVFYAV